MNQKMKKNIDHHGHRSRSSYRHIAMPALFPVLG